jgi:hypothetical protein
MCVAILGLTTGVVLLLAPIAAGGARPPKNPIARLSAKVESIARKSKSRVYEVPTGFAVVGNTAYQAIWELRANVRGGAGTGGSDRSMLVAVDLGTGLRRNLYVKRDELLLGLAASGGRLYGLVYGVTDRNLVEFRLLDFTADPAAPRLVYREKRGSFGALPARLAGMTAQGEAILVQPYVGANCEFDWYWEEGPSGTWIDCAHLVAVASDGTRRPLAEYVDLSTPVVATTDRLIFRRGMRVVALRPDGTETDLWNGDFSSIDVSPAGEVLVSWSSGDKTDFYDGPDPIGESPGNPTGATGPTGDDLDPNAPASGIARLPLDAPAGIQQPVTDTDREISTGVACGGGIVRMVAITDGPDELRSLAEVMATVVVAPSGKVTRAIGGAVGIELRSMTGDFVRTLGTIKADLVAEPMCSDGRVVVPYVAYTRDDNTWGPSRYGVFDAR